MDKKCEKIFRDIFYSAYSEAPEKCLSEDWKLVDYVLEEIYSDPDYYKKAYQMHQNAKVLTKELYLIAQEFVTKYKQEKEKNASS